MSREGRKDHAQSTNNKLDDGAQDEHVKSSKNSCPKVDPKLALLQDTWLESELEVIELKTRKRKGGSVGEALAAAKKRRDVLWKQLLGEWKKGWKRSAKFKSKVAREPAAPVDQSAEHDEAGKLIEPGEQAGSKSVAGEPNEAYEQDESEDFDSEHDESDEQPEEPDEEDEEVAEPPRKRSRRQRSPTEARRPPPTSSKQGLYTTQQKDVIRSWICDNLGAHGGPLEEMEPIAKAAGLTVKQVRHWIYEFYQYFPQPTTEQAMAYRQHDSSYLDILNEWFTAHRDDPYPSQEEKQRLANETGKTLQQINDWFVNTRQAIGLVRAARPEFSPDQLATLRASFQANKFPSAAEKQRVAHETGLDLRRVVNWFNNIRLRGHRVVKPRVKDKGPLFAWLHHNMENPYPSVDEKKELAKEARLTLQQVDFWFTNTRVKIRRNTGKKEYEGLCPCCGEANV